MEETERFSAPNDVVRSLRLVASTLRVECAETVQDRVQFLGAAFMLGLLGTLLLFVSRSF